MVIGETYIQHDPIISEDMIQSYQRIDMVEHFESIKKEASSGKFSRVTAEPGREPWAI